jgi:CYTH domain-containing protein
MQDEFELTYLVKYLPEDFSGEHESKEILDIYIPATSEHALLRLRKRGEIYEMTKKVLASGTDSSHQIEYTVPLSEVEFDALATVEGKKVHKIRHYYKEDDLVFEIDVFQDALEGLILVDVEFSSNDAKSKFVPPDWFGSDVTQEKFVAGGVLCGKTYRDIEQELIKHAYERIPNLNRSTPKTDTED